MTLDDLLDESRWIINDAHRATGSRSVEIAQTIIDLLGESQPCGIEQLPVAKHADGEYAVAFDGALFGASEMRALCAMYLRAADKVDELNKARSNG